MKRPPPGENGAATASDMALLALGYLAAEEERLMRFLALTGLDRGDVADMLGDHGFQLAILDHLAGDETMLVDFAEQNRVAPESIGVARRALGGGEAF